MSEIDELRTRHDVRALKGDEEGYPLARLPDGTYGFTYSPGQDETPVFGNHAYHSFEVHRLKGGAERLIGYVAAAGEAILDARKPGTEVTVYPAVWADSTRLVSVDLAGTVRAKRTPPREDGNPYRVIFE